VASKRKKVLPPSRRAAKGPKRVKRSKKPAKSVPGPVAPKLPPPGEMAAEVQKSRVRSVAVRPATPEESPFYLRRLAGAYYVTDERGISIRDMHKIEPFSSVSQVTLERWSVEDCWVEERERFFDALTVKVKQKIQEDIQARELLHLQRVEAVLDDLFERVLPGQVKDSDGVITTMPAPQPGSLEGLVRAIQQMLKSRADLQRTVGAAVQVQPGEGAPGEGSTMDTALSVEDLRVATMAVVEARREKARQDMAKRMRADGDDPEAVVDAEALEDV